MVALGSIRKRAGVPKPGRKTGTATYEARIPHPTRKLPSGAAVVLTARHKSKAEAEAWLTQTRAELLADSGALDPKTPMTVGEAVESWLARVERDGEGKRGAISSNTAKSYRELVRNQVLARIDGVPDIATLPVSKMTPDLVEKWSSALSGAHGRGMAQRALRVLKRALDVAVRGHAITANPGTSVKLAAIRKRREDDGRVEIILQSADVDEIERIAGIWATLGYDPKNPADKPSPQQAADRRAVWSRHLTMISILRHTGVRIGEALALQRKSVDLAAGVIEVKGTLTVADGVDKVSGRRGSKIGPPKTAAGRREVAIGSAGLNRLRQWMLEQEASSPAGRRARTTELKRNLGTNQAVADALGISETAVRKRLASERDAPEIPTGDLFVFGANGGATWQLASNFWSDAWAPLMLAAGLVDEDGSMPGPHDLRHYYASIAIGAGVTLEDLTAQLGHESIDVTLKHYHHLLGDKRRRVQAMAALIDRHTESNVGLEK